MKFRSFFSGEHRSVKAKKNIIASALIKGLDTLVYLMLVPITLGYLNPYEYGIWLTLSSILMWINSLDIGLGNGMRNKLTEAIAQNNKELGQIYVSTTFIMLIVLMSCMILLGSIIGPFIDWYDILSASYDKVPHLSEIVNLSFIIFCINFIFKFIGNIYLAMQLPAINNLLVVAGHILSLIIIYILTLTVPGNLLLVAVVYSASPLIIYLVAYPITFGKIFPYLKPSFKAFRKDYLKNLVNVSLQFFILQLSGIVLFSLANIMISHLFGPEEVTPYSIAYRYLSSMLMVSNLILAPMWSATTDAYIRGDIEWIKRSILKIHKLLILVIGCVTLMTVFSGLVYKLWIGSNVYISISLTISIGVYVCILIWSMSYSNFLNGLGKLKLQTMISIISALVFIPLCYILGKYFDVVGIVIGMCILNFGVLIINKIQFTKVIENRAIGLWNK